MFNRLIRIMRKMYMKGIPLVPQVISSIVRILYSCDMKPTTDIFPSATIFHNGLGCVFHENTVIEDGVRIYQNVTLGGGGRLNTNLEKGEDHPTISKGATIYAGACVLGPVTVGENSVVGANAVVLCDVPPDCLAVGVPAVIKPRRQNRAR